MSIENNESSRYNSLLDEGKRGALGIGGKMKSNRKIQHDYVLPSESDDTGMDSQGSSWTFSSVGTGNWTMGTLGTNYTTDSAYVETILRGDDLNYVKQKYGNLSIVISALQLFMLTMLLALCGFAPLNINPSIGPYPDALSLIGGTNSYEIISHFQIWRIVTTPFLHAGILHFLCIVGIQLELGAFLEREWGSKTWLSIYVTSSISSALCDSSFNVNGVSVGSTGPLMGLLGAKISEIIMLMCFKTVDTYLVDGVHQLMAILFTLFFVSLLTFFPYVEWGGHIGGLIGGFIAGMLLFSGKIKRHRNKKIWFYGGVIIGVSFCVLVFSWLIIAKPNEELADVCEYYENLHPENYYCECGL